MEQKEHITLTRLQGIIKEALWHSLEPSYWVSAELSELKVNSSGHCYMELLEKGERGHQAKAKVKAVIWRNSYVVIEDYFLRSTGSKLASGMQVLVNISISYHELYGLSLVVNDIDPSYTLGDIERTRRQTILQLKEDGIFEMNKELDEATVLQNLAVISSPNAAGFEDFIKELASYQSIYGYKLTLYSAAMQGEQTQADVTSALERIVSSGIDYDAVVIIRGGGSQSDLSAFDSYVICNYIAQCPIPVITGIGHERDISVADMVAHTSVKTPTAVARHIIDSFDRVASFLDSASRTIKESVRERVQGEERYLQQRAGAIERVARTLLHSKAVSLSSTTERLRGSVARFTITKQQHLTQLSERLPKAARFALAKEHDRLLAFEQVTEAFSPKRIFELGYSLVRDGRGGFLRSVQGVKSGDVVTVELLDGKVETTVNRIL